MPLNRMKVAQGYKNIAENRKCLKRAFKLILERITIMTEENNAFINVINNIKIKKEKDDYIKNEILFCGNCKTPKSMHFPSEKESFKNKIVPIMCECRKNEIKEYKKQEEINKAYNRVDTLIYKGIMDKNYLKYDINQDDKKNDEMTNFYYNYIQNWETIKKEGIGVLLFGDIGVGKTFFAYCIANELLKRGEKICITNFMKILNIYKNFEEEDLNNIINMICNSTLLVIDDFGAERKTEFANEKILEIVDSRSERNLPNIITTNLDFEKSNTEDITLKRIHSRINKMCNHKIAIYGEDRRKRTPINKLDFFKK